MISNALLNKVLSEINSECTYIGIGTGTEPSPEDTLLISEKLRKAVDSYIDDNAVIKEIYIDESEGNDTKYINIGVFGGDATTAINTGTLQAGGVINIQKDNTQSLTISVEITVERVWDYGIW